MFLDHLKGGESSSWIFFFVEMNELDTPTLYGSEITPRARDHSDAGFRFFSNVSRAILDFPKMFVSLQDGNI